MRGVWRSKPSFIINIHSFTRWMEAGLGDEMEIVTVAKRCQRESKWSKVLLSSVQKMGF